MCLAKCSAACPWSPATPFTSGEDGLVRRVEVSVVVGVVARGFCSARGVPQGTFPTKEEKQAEN